MNIGRAAKLSGLSTKMVRYYEQVGLLGGIRRTEAGYRDFDRNDVALLRFIRRARDLGMTVPTIATVLRALASGEEIRPLLDAHARTLEEHIAVLTHERNAIRQTERDWCLPLTREELASVQSRAASARDKLAWSPQRGSEATRLASARARGFRAMFQQYG